MEIDWLGATYIIRGLRKYRGYTLRKWRRMFPHIREDELKSSPTIVKIDEMLKYFEEVRNGNNN